MILAVVGFGMPSAYAIVDLNGNGMSDVWEQFFGAEGVSPSTDSDGDGQTNLAESAAGYEPVRCQLRAEKHQVECHQRQRVR